MFVAALSPAEPRHARADALLRARGAVPFLVPALFPVEVVAAFARRGESPAMLDAVEVLVRGPRFHPVPLDAALLDRARAIAREARLRAYDAVYVAVAAARTASLITFDEEVATRVGARFPEIRIES